MPGPPIKRSQRPKGSPTWLKNFVCNPKSPITTTPASPQDHLPSPSPILNSTCLYHLIKPLDLAHLSSNYVASLVTVLQTPEPCSYAQGKQYPE